MRFLPKEGIGKNCLPLLLIDTLTIKILKLIGTTIEAFFPPLIISSSLTCGGILNVSCTTSLISNIITVILSGYSLVHNALT